MLLDSPPDRKTASDERSDGRLSTAALLDLLGDEYTRAVLKEVANGPRSGTTVAENTSMSKPTAFRRLNRLAEVGLVSVRQHIDTEQGHHHKVYEASHDTLEIEIESLLESFET